MRAVIRIVANRFGHGAALSPPRRSSGDPPSRLPLLAVLWLGAGVIGACGSPMATSRPRPALSPTLAAPRKAHDSGIWEDLTLTGGPAGHISHARVGLCGAAGGQARVVLRDLDLGAGGGSLLLSVSPYRGPQRYPVSPPQGGPGGATVSLRPDPSSPPLTGMSGSISVDAEATGGSVDVELASPGGKARARLVGSWRCGRPAPPPPSPSPGMIPWVVPSSPG